MARVRNGESKLTVLPPAGRGGRTTTFATNCLKGNAEIQFRLGIVCIS